MGALLNMPLVSVAWLLDRGMSHLISLMWLE